MLDNPQLADSVTLEKTQEIINYINTKIPRNIRFNHLDILDAQNDIRAAQLDAFPQMAVVRAEYGKFANDYKLVKNALRPGSTVNAIRSNFNGNVEIQDAAKRVFTPEIQKAMAGHRGEIVTRKFIKRFIGWGLVGGAASLGGKGVTDLYKLAK